MRIFYIILVFVFSLNLLHSQVNEFQVLLNQARSHENRNQLSQALEIYEQLYETFPHDENLIEAMTRILYQRGNFARANEILQNSRGRVSEYFFARQETVYLLRTNRLREAEQRAVDWLTRNPRSVQHYREFARIFENSNQFDLAIVMYIKARTNLNDTNLFTHELSNAYFFTRNVEKAFEESLKFLRTNSGFLYFYRNRFEEMIAMHQNNIRILESLIGENEPTVIWEILAFSLIGANEFRRAIEIYDRLPLERLISFSDDMKASNQIEIAMEALQRALERAENQAQTADIQIKIAQIHFEQNDTDNTLLYLYKVIDNSALQQQPWAQRTRANVEARLIRALISMQQLDTIDETRRWFEEASRFSFNSSERADILFRLSRFLYLSKEYTQAFRTIEQAVQGHDRNSNVYKSSYFHRYEIALFQQSSIRDSLLVECIIHNPADQRIADMLFLETFLTI